MNYTFTTAYVVGMTSERGIVYSCPEATTDWFKFAWGKQETEQKTIANQTKMANLAIPTINLSPFLSNEVMRTARRK